MYILKNKDIELIYFDIVEYYGEKEIVIHEILSNSLPLNLHVSDTGLKKWIEHRRAPINREHIEKLLELCGIRDIQSYIEATFCLSLMDTFWVAPHSEIKFKDVSLFDNPLNETVAKFAFSGNYNGKLMSTTKLHTPELTTDGALAKRWRRTNSGIILQKAGTSGFSNAGKEPWSEYFSSQLLDELGFYHIGYNLSKVEGRVVSTCDLFTTEKVGFLQFHNISEVRNIRGIIEVYNEMGFLDELCEILVFDALTCNVDRHLGNFGFLIDNDTQEILRPAPMYDNGEALLSKAVFSTVEEALNYDGWKYPRLYNNFNEIAKLAFTLSPELRKKVRALKGFKFKNHSKYPMEEKRLKILETVIHYKVHELLRN